MGLATPILRIVLNSLANATIPLHIIRRPKKDAVHSMMSCCSWRSGEAGGKRWSSSEDGIKVGKVLHTWEELRDQALESGLVGELVVEAPLTLTFERVDHPRWKTQHPYSMMTTDTSIREELERSTQWTRR